MILFINFFRKYFFFVLLLIFIWECSPTKTADNSETVEWLPVTEEVNGFLEEQNGIPVLKVWGSPYEQGYAHGYLLAPAFVTLLNGYITDPNVDIDATSWDTSLNLLQIFEFPSDYQQELQGILHGMENRAGGDVFIQGLNRTLIIDDLRGLQSDLDKIQCSSFAAWGGMTEDSCTITGRNMDFNPVGALMNSQLIIVRNFDSDSEKLSWISVSWPGEIGCTTGMNEQGVTVSQQDVYRYPPTVSEGFIPDNLVHRMIIESAHAETVVEDVENILSSNYVTTGCAPLISWPSKDNGYASVVPEFDGKLSVTNGYSIRIPQEGQEFQVSTNHFRLRSTPLGDCWRYNLIENNLNQISVSAGTNHLTVAGSWILLKDCPIAETVVMHSVVFEPNKLRLHIAFTDNGQHAPDCSKVTFNLYDLLNI